LARRRFTAERADTDVLREGAAQRFEVRYGEAWKRKPGERHILGGIACCIKRLSVCRRTKRISAASEKHRSLERIANIPRPDSKSAVSDDGVQGHPRRDSIRQSLVIRHQRASDVHPRRNGQRSKCVDEPKRTLQRDAPSEA